MHRNCKRIRDGHLEIEQNLYKFHGTARQAGKNTPNQSQFIARRSFYLERNCIGHYHGYAERSLTKTTEAKQIRQQYDVIGKSENHLSSRNSR